MSTRQGQKVRPAIYRDGKDVIFVRPCVGRAKLGQIPLMARTGKRARDAMHACRYADRMRVQTGRFVRGQIVLKDSGSLREGEVVTIVARDAEDGVGIEVGQDDEDELAAALGEADRGEGIEAGEFFVQLRRERGRGTT
jgi:hypothetical protein